MGDVLPFVNTALLAAVLAALFVLSRKRPGQSGLETKLEVLRDNLERLERSLREEIARNREELAAGERGTREEVSRSLSAVGEAERAFREELSETLRGSLKLVSDSVAGQISESNASQRAFRDELAARFSELCSAVENRLEQMRQTVDEKLQGTLEKRLGESFRIVSDRLEQVYRGLGEMQSLASGVGDLKRVLTNVKTRGTWGEVQLGNLLDEVLTAGQFERNVSVTGGLERVEFAIRLPGRDEAEAPVWLPIDAKFPQEDYERLLDAVERADAAGVEEAGRQLEGRVRASAREISRKYILPPRTTDFAILYLPTEGLYAEVLRRPGLADGLQRECRVVLAGPMTLTALLNSLQMGFRTLAIERRSGEVWKVLGAVKTEFQKYGEVLEKVQKKLEEASKTVETAAVRTRAIHRRLRDVEAAPEEAELPVPAERDELERVMEG